MKLLGKLSFISLVAALALAASPATARAQELVRADVPFGFTAGATDFSPGEYTLSINWNEREVTVHDDERGQNYFVPIITNMEKNPRKQPSTAYLVFDKKGDDGHVLSQVWMEGPDSNGVQVARMKGAHKPSTSLAARQTAASSAGQ